jgi:hypothetical protein
METDVDALFKLPLGEFTSARNALVARLKKADRPTDAAAVKALAKPSVSAWAVNQLYWRHGDLFARLFEAGGRLRRAQSSQQTGNLTRELVNARQEAVAALRQAAMDVLQEGGYGATRDLMRRITASLEALSAYGSRPGAPAAGRLSDDVEPPGFEWLAELPRAGAATRGTGAAPPRAQAPVAKGGAAKAARAPKAGRTADPFDAAARRRERQRAAAAAKGEVREAERALALARKHVERAAAKLEAAAERAQDSQRRRAEAERQLGRAAKEAEAALDAARAAEAAARDATQEAESAQRTLDLARDRLERLESGG